MKPCQPLLKKKHPRKGEKGREFIHRKLMLGKDQVQGSKIAQKRGGPQGGKGTTKYVKTSFKKNFPLYFEGSPLSRRRSLGSYEVGEIQLYFYMFGWKGFFRWDRSSKFKNKGTD